MLGVSTEVAVQGELDLTDALDGLSEDFRTALVMCDVVGMSYDEIAEARQKVADAEIDFETVIPGHGAVMKRADFDKWRKSMDSVLAEVTKLKKAGKSKEEVASTLKLEDHGWASGRFFMQRSLPGLYDEIK